MLDGHPNRIIGLAKSMQVLPGDTIDMEVYGLYNSPISSNNDIVLGIGPAILSAFGVSAFVTGELLKAYNSMNGLIASGSILVGANWDETEDDPPMAYINYLLFDKNFVKYDHGYSSFDTNSTNGEFTKLSLQASLTKPGYIYIYLSNETPKR